MFLIQLLDDKITKRLRLLYKLYIVDELMFKPPLPLLTALLALTGCAAQTTTPAKEVYRPLVFVKPLQDYSALNPIELIEESKISASILDRDLDLNYQTDISIEEFFESKFTEVFSTVIDPSISNKKMPYPQFKGTVRELFAKLEERGLFISQSNKEPAVLKISGVTDLVLKANEPAHKNALLSILGRNHNITIEGDQIRVLSISRKNHLVLIDTIKKLNEEKRSVKVLYELIPHEFNNESLLELGVTDYYDKNKPVAIKVTGTANSFFNKMVAKDKALKGEINLLNNFSNNSRALGHILSFKDSVLEIENKSRPQALRLNAQIHQSYLIFYEVEDVRYTAKLVVIPQVLKP